MGRELVHLGDDRQQTWLLPQSDFTRAKLEDLLKAVDAGSERQTYRRELELGNTAQDHDAPEARKARAGDLMDKIKGLQAARQRHEQMLVATRLTEAAAAHHSQGQEPGAWPSAVAGWD